MSDLQPQGFGSPNQAGYAYQPSAQLLGGLPLGSTDWMGPWSPSVYGKLDTPQIYGNGTTSARLNSQRNPNLFEMNFRASVPSPSLGVPESNTRGGWDDSDINNSTQQLDSDWQQTGQRKRALSSPALWDSSSRAQNGGYFDSRPYDQPSAHDGSSHKHTSSGQSQHPDMHDSINAISSLANFNQNSQQPAPRQSARNHPPPQPAPRSKRQRKTATVDDPNESDSSQQAAKEENDELELDQNEGSHDGTGGAKGAKEGMDAEAQRKDLLDRNRIAARKSREKRKREVQALEQTIRNYTSQNASLHSLTVSLSAELQQLRDLLQNHNQCVHGGQGLPPPSHMQPQRASQPIMSGGGRRR